MTFTAYEVLSDEKKRKQYDRFGEEGMKEQPGFEGFNFNFDDFFKGFSGFGNSKGQKRRSNGGGFKFSFDDIFSQHDDDDDEDSLFGTAHHGFGGHGFGGHGFGDDLFSFGSNQETFTKTETRSSGKHFSITK